MTRRILSVWLPRLATDRIARARPETRGKAVAAVLRAHNLVTVAAVNEAAEAASVAPGHTLSDARALCAGLTVAEADPAGDLRALARLADWCGRYTPWAAVDRSGGLGVHDVNNAGLWLDISGCAHLFGGEAALMADLARRLDEFGFRARMAAADTPGAAWAWARFGDARNRPALATGSQPDALAPLPTAALRLHPADLDTLARLGLRRIGDLYTIPRAALAARFGADIHRRLDQALGNRAEPVSPRRRVAPLEARLAFAEPINRPEDIAAGLMRLLASLCARLEAEGLGARRLRFTLYRIDGTTAEAAIAASQPSRAPHHLSRLFAPRLENLDPDPGVELLVLAAPATQRLVPAQTGVSNAEGTAPDRDVAQLVDRLVNRLGGGAVLRLAPRERTLPEQRSTPVPAPDVPPDAWRDWRDRRPAPLRLFPRAEPVEAAPRDHPRDRPPAAFIWRGRRHRVARADGPEHLMGPWWREGAGTKASRAYYRIEDQAGRRLWLFQDRHSARWYVHGLFG